METIANNMDKFVINEKDAMKIFRSIRWVDGVYCPKCKSFEGIVSRGKQGKSNSNKYTCTKCNNNFSDFTNTFVKSAKIPFGKILYMIVHIKVKSMKTFAKELKLHRNTVQRYHKRIREFLLENHENVQFDGEIEMDETYIIAGEKGLKKTQLQRDHQEKEH